MAKVTINIDTAEGTLSASINGKAVENIEQVMAYVYKDGYSSKSKEMVGVNISTKTEDAEGVRTYTSICAKNSKEGIEAMKQGTTASKYDDFLVNPVPPKIDIPSEHTEVKEKIKSAFAGFFGNNGR